MIRSISFTESLAVGGEQGSCRTDLGVARCTSRHRPRRQ